MGKKNQIHDMNQPLASGSFDACEFSGLDEGTCDDMFPDELDLPASPAPTSEKEVVAALRRKWALSQDFFERDGAYFGQEEEPGDNEILRWSIQAEFMARERKEASAKIKELSEKRRHWRLALELGWDQATQEELEAGMGLFLEVFTPEGSGNASGKHLEAQRVDQKGLVSLVGRAARLGIQIEQAKLGGSRSSTLATCLMYSSMDLCAPLVQEGLVDWQAWPRGAKAFGGISIEDGASAILEAIATKELVLQPRRADSMAERGMSNSADRAGRTLEEKLATLALFCGSSDAIRAKVAKALALKIDELARRAWEIAPVWSVWRKAGLSREKSLAIDLGFALDQAQAKACGERLAVAIKGAQRKIDEAMAWSSACQCALEIDSASLLETLFERPALLCEEARAAQPGKSALIGPEGMMARALKADARRCVEALAARGEWGVEPRTAGLRPVQALAGLAAAATDGSDDERAAWGKAALGGALGVFAKGAQEAGHGPEEVSQWLDGILTGAIAGKKGQALCKAQACILSLMLDVQVSVGMAQPSPAPTRGGMRL